MLLQPVPFGRNLKGSFTIPNLGARGECYGVGMCTNRTTSQYKRLLCLSPFGRNSTVKLWPLNSTPIRGDWDGHRGSKNCTNRNVVPKFIFDFYAHCRPILHRLTIRHNNATDRRQTERSEYHRRPNKAIVS